MRYQRIRNNLTAAGDHLPDGEHGLPDWTAAVAAGDEAPHGVPPEVVDDLRLLGENLDLPAVKQPKVSIETASPLAASASGEFEAKVSVQNPDDLAAANAEGVYWRDTNDREFLMPAGLSSALEEWRRSTPKQQNQSTHEATASETGA